MATRYWSDRSISMAKLIKQGKCEYQFIPRGHFRAGPGEGGSGNESFSNLHCLIPGTEADAMRSEPCPDMQDTVRAHERKAEKIILEARRQADAARAEADRIVEQARKRADEIENEAYIQGYEQGKKDGEEIGRRQFEVGLRHLESALRRLKEESKRLPTKYEAQMLQAVLAVAGRLTEMEICQDSDLIKRVLKAAMEKTIEGSNIMIHLHPRDHEHLDGEFLSTLSAPGGNRIEVKPDASITRGGCLIETEFGLVDASLESRWFALLEGINELLRERTGIEIDEYVRRPPVPKDRD